MKIELIKINLNNGSTYKYKPLDWCCNGLRDNPCVNLCSEDIVNVDYEDDGRFQPKMCISDNYEDGDYEDHWMTTDNHPIKFCPFCGEEITISTAAEEDYSKELEILETEMNEILKEIRRTDSKKKTEELNEQRRILDKRINYLYEFGEYEDGNNN